ncbi:MAG: CCA tRNA nucleotidyltransferase [Oscillospiraceae bacterium]|nr:CCA tRNA nucleotidyltransferase [Oscillospiraceae bacterium]
MAYFIPKEIEFVLLTLKNSGFDAFLVGGCVRDMLSGSVPHDYDIATSATPTEIQQIFEHTVATGIKHGTVTVIVNKIPVEVTTFRLEGDYSDTRHPDNVSFLRSVDEDLSRRDFTVNALAYYPPDNTLIDLFGGVKDLENKILRAVGDPDKRFCEDALRILRLFRFASVLNHSIEANTLSSALNHSKLLQNVSLERIMAELKKAVCGQNTAVLKMLIDIGALFFIKLTESKALEKISLLPNSNNLRLFAFLKLSSTDINSSLEILRASNAEKHYCKTLNTLVSSNDYSDKTAIKKLLSISSPEMLFDALEYKKAVFGEDVLKPQKFIKEILENNEPYLVSHLKVNGDDLLKLGYKGKDLREKLEALVSFVIENPDENVREKLLEKL